MTASKRCPLGTLALVISALAHADPEVDLQDLVNRLDSEELVQRESACDELESLLSPTENPGGALITEARVVEVLRQEGLSLEQRVRLFSALRDRFMAGPRGAIGVQFSQVQRLEAGAEIQILIDGFPAKENQLLFPGDIITAADGVSLIGPAAVEAGPNGLVRQTVFSHDPGETLELTVVRRLNKLAPLPQPPAPAIGDLDHDLMPPNGMLITEGPGRNAEIVRVLVPLGSFANLRGGGGVIDGETLERAWQARVARMQIPIVGARALTSAPGTRYGSGGRPASQQRHETIVAGNARPGAQEGIRQTLAQSTSLAIADPALRPGGPVQVINGQGRIFLQQGNIVLDPLMPRKGQRAGPFRRNANGGGELDVDTVTMMLRRAKLEQRQEVLSRNSRNGQLSPQNAKAVREEIDLIQAQINAIDAELMRRIEEKAKEDAKP